MTNSHKSAGGGRSKPTWQRRLLQVGEKFGLHITDIQPGTALVSRKKAAAKLTEISPDLSLLAGGPAGTVSYEPLNDGAWVLTTKRGTGINVAKVGKRGWLVAERDASPLAELNLETQTLQHLGGRHVAWLLQRYQVDLVLDVGANNGQFASGLRRAGYRGHIVSFEPVPKFVEAMVKLSAKDPKWTVQQVALGSTEGTAPIHVQRTFSSLLPSSDYGKQRFTTLRQLSDTEQIDVPLRRLDTIFDELLAPVIASGVKQPRVYLKMDTQGFDLEVFRGLGERVHDVVGLQSEVALLLIYEQMPRMPEALATYEAAGFEISGLYPVTREPDGRVIEYDCTMVRASTAPVLPK